jgi:hypothetical protein
MTPFWAKLVWVVGIICWYVIRYPHQRRSRRTAKKLRADRTRELVLLAISFTGLFVIPVVYVAAGQPSFADYAFHP